MIVVIGMGSTLRGDDAVGLRVIDRLALQVRQDVRLVRCNGSLDELIEAMTGCSGAVIVDALLDPCHTIGTVTLWEGNDEPGSFTGSHRASIADALRLGKVLGLTLPEGRQIAVVGIVVSEVDQFGEQLSAEVEQAIPDACAFVSAILNRLRGHPRRQPPAP